MPPARRPARRLHGVRPPLPDREPLPAGPNDARAGPEPPGPRGRGRTGFRIRLCARSHRCSGLSPQPEPRRRRRPRGCRNPPGRSAPGCRDAGQGLGDPARRRPRRGRHATCRERRPVRRRRDRSARVLADERHHRSGYDERALASPGSRGGPGFPVPSRPGLAGSLPEPRLHLRRGGFGSGSGADPPESGPVCRSRAAWPGLDRARQRQGGHDRSAGLR